MNQDGDGSRSETTSSIAARWRRGSHNLLADRELAEAMATLDPWIPAACKANREFLGRAVLFLAAHGIGRNPNLSSRSLNPQPDLQVSRISVMPDLI